MKNSLENQVGANGIYKTNDTYATSDGISHDDRKIRTLESPLAATSTFLAFVADFWSTGFLAALALATFFFF